MQRNNNVLIITIVLGVLALGATAFLLLTRSTSPTPAPVAVVPTPTPAPRWVAVRDIPPRTEVVPTMMRKEVRAGAVDKEAIASFDQLHGLITKERIPAGETIKTTSFNPAIQRQVAANIPIPTGMRGVAIWVDPAQTAGGLIDVGDHVDVVAVHKLTIDKAPRQYLIGAQQFSAGRTIGENLLVLGVDKSINAPAPTPTPVPGAPVEAAGPPPAPTPVPAPNTTSRTRVLLAAPPEIASRLIAANDQGVLHVTIRNPSDGDTGPVPETNEFPTKVYTAAKETTAASSGSVKPIKMPEMGPVPVPTLMPVMPVGTPMPTMPTDKEITVVRGTEKTRVLVPQR